MGNQRQSTAEDSFGRRVRLEREQRGWSQAQLAERLRAEGLTLHFSAIAKIENRDVESPRQIRLDEAQALARVFGLPIGDLLAEHPGFRPALTATRVLAEAATAVEAAAADARDAVERFVEEQHVGSALAAAARLDSVVSPVYRARQTLERTEGLLQELLATSRPHRQKLGEQIVDEQSIDPGPEPDREAEDRDRERALRRSLVSRVDPRTPDQLAEEDRQRDEDEQRLREDEERWREGLGA